MKGELRRGFILTLPVALSAAVYGSVLGVLAAGKGLAWYELLVMDVSVFAGTAQFVMVDMWTEQSIPVIQMVIAVLIMNFRYLLIGASLKPLFAGESLAKKMSLIHLVADENWAITMAEHRKGTGTIWFLFGGGLCLVTLWSISTMLGLQAGNFINDPSAYALDFVVIAVFTALCTSLYRGKEDIIPYLAAALASTAAYEVVPGKWYIVIGAAAGALCTLLQKEENA